MECIDIVIATYNGEKYIKSQIESIISDGFFETFVSNIIISDDNSTDDTLDIIKSFRHPKIKIYKNDKQAGVCNNFENALRYTKSEFIIFSDQDDVWISDRIKCLLDGIRSLNGTYRAFFSDLIVVDEKLNQIDSSFWRSQGIKPDRVFSEKLLAFQNVSPGCAMIINRDLLLLGTPFPKDIIMHDWWFLLLASSVPDSGIGYTEKPTILYRQHGNNVIGAKSLSCISVIKRLINGESNTYINNINQVKCLERVLMENNHVNNNINLISNFNDMSVFRRIYTAFTLKLTGSSAIRTVFFYLRLLTIR